MVKKITKYAKFVVCCALILSLIAPSYAALSASDGSAFVTKAEFDSALADFNARLTTFEAGINSKIDSQVTSYLDRNGIWNGAVQDVQQPSSRWILNVPYNDEFKMKNATMTSYVYFQNVLQAGEVVPSFTVVSASITSDEDGKVLCKPEQPNQWQYLYTGNWNGGNGHYLSTDKGSFDNIPWFKCNKSGLAYITGRDRIQNDIGEYNSATTPAQAESGSLNQFLMFNTYSSPLRHPGELSTMSVKKEIWLREFNAQPTTVGDDKAVIDVNLMQAKDMYTFNSRYETRDLTNVRYTNGAYSRLQLTTVVWEDRSAFAFVQKNKYYVYDFRIACSDPSARNYFLSQANAYCAVVIVMDPIKCVVY